MEQAITNAKREEGQRAFEQKMKEDEEKRNALIEKIIKIEVEQGAANTKREEGQRVFDQKMKEDEEKRNALIEKIEKMGTEQAIKNTKREEGQRAKMDLLSIMDNFNVSTSPYTANIFPIKNVGIHCVCFLRDHS